MWQKRGWMPSTRLKSEYSRLEEISDLVRFHWLYVFGLALAGVLLSAAAILILHRTKMI